MADIDSNNLSRTMEDDPAADFLAREQNELAGLEDDNIGGSDEPQGDDFGGLESGAPDSGVQNGDFADDLGGFENNATDGLEDVSPSFNQSGGLLDFGEAPSNQSAGLLDMDSGLLPEADLSAPQDSGYSAISQQDAVRVEPEKIRKWREDQKERLEKKDIAEAKKMDEWKATAKKELEDWYKHHAEQLAKTKENNLAAEKAFIKDRDVSVPGHEWEKICALCEFNPKVNKTTKDITRMRSLLLQLKQTPLVR